MLNLPTITLVSIDCVNAIESVSALRYSARNIEFKESILLTNENIQVAGIRTIQIDKLHSVNEYNDFVLRLNEYIDSDYILLIQADGYVLNADHWSNDFLLFDYIGASWPNEQSWIDRQEAKYYMRGNWNRVGNGGFSLRSRRFLELSANFKTCAGYGEDNFLCVINHDYMVDNGIKFAPVELAEKLSRENNLQDWTNPGIHDPNISFGFHGKNFSNYQELINFKG